ncbi:MAG TPA: hypothetical protein VGO61_16530 [Steroidobacteraceae bacterium]|jgi:hypothetical protein|nr:hypothetical protein [Steroidobacteraceae bacterium]
MMVGILLCVAGIIYGLLGALHALYTLLDIRDPRRIVPDDPLVLTAMRESKIRLTRGESTVWEGWVGFNLSHSLGALMFAAACFIVAACFRIFAFSPWALFALAAVSALYLLLAVQYWFRIPIVGTAISTACLTAAWMLYLL